MYLPLINCCASSWLSLTSLQKLVVLANFNMFEYFSQTSGDSSTGPYYVFPSYTFQAPTPQHFKDLKIWFGFSSDCTTTEPAVITPDQKDWHIKLMWKLMAQQVLQRKASRNVQWLITLPKMCFLVYRKAAQLNLQMCGKKEVPANCWGRTKAQTMRVNTSAFERIARTTSQNDYFFDSEIDIELDYNHWLIK